MQYDRLYTRFQPCFSNKHGRFTRLVGRIVEHSYFPLLLGRPMKTSRPWTNISPAVDGALNSQASHTYNRCRYTPGSLPSLNGARYVCTPQESRYFHAPITSCESCNLIGSNRFLPVAWILGRCSQTVFFTLAHVHRSGSRD